MKLLFLALLLTTSLLLCLDIATKGAKAATEETPACEAIAHAGALLLFRCEDDETGQVLYVNNIGFIALAD